MKKVLFLVVMVGSILPVKGEDITFEEILLNPKILNSNEFFGHCGYYAAIYGEDNREDYCAHNLILRSLAHSVAALFSIKDEGDPIREGKEDYYLLGETTLGESFSLAPGERFSSQPSLSFCSGFLVGDDLLATAGHCIYDEKENNPKNPKLREMIKCENIKVVFGYRKNLDGMIPKKIHKDNVYDCKKVVAISYKSGPDYAVIQLDRKVKGRRPLPINRENADLKEGTKLFVIGHPSGLPLKIAGDAEVRFLRKEDWLFFANLDTFAGNSGSPVINAETLLVEGILVRGLPDYMEMDNGLTRAIVYPSSWGKERVTKISILERYIPYNFVEKKAVEMNRKAVEKKSTLYEMLRSEYAKEEYEMMIRAYEESKKRSKEEQKRNKTKKRDKKLEKKLDFSTVAFDFNPDERITNSINYW